MSFLSKLWGKKSQSQEQESSQEKKGNLILSMPMFCGENPYSVEKIVEDLRNYWNLEVSEVSENDGVASFIINGKMAFIAPMSAPIPNEDLERIFPISYLWNNVEEEVKSHTSFAIVTLMSSNHSDVERYKILTKINASILRTSSQAIGVYQSSQTLLLPKGLYLDFANFLLEEQLPIQLWVYMGIFNQENSSSIYTYGLKEFGKTEIEIIDAPMSGGDLYDFLLPILAYILGYDVTLKDGETIGFSEEQKIKISQSKGVYLEGETLKLAL